MNRREAIGAGIAALVGCFVPKTKVKAVERDGKIFPNHMTYTEEESFKWNLGNKKLRDSFDRFVAAMEEFSEKAKTSGKAIQTFGTHLTSVQVSIDLDREQLYELGRKGPYHNRYIDFPVELQNDIAKEAMGKCLETL